MYEIGAGTSEIRWLIGEKINSGFLYLKILESWMFQCRFSSSAAYDNKQGEFAAKEGTAQMTSLFAGYQ